LRAVVDRTFINYHENIKMFNTGDVDAQLLIRYRKGNRYKAVRNVCSVINNVIMEME
jgi:hypothetical protein